jgi:sec-independent protein translocase protein TatA
MPGVPELLLILLIVLLIFGAGKLPSIGDSLGRSIRNFKRASGGEDEIEVSKKKAPAKVKTVKVEQLEDADDDDEDEADEAEVVAAAAKKKVKKADAS